MSLNAVLAGNALIRIALDNSTVERDINSTEHRLSRMASNLSATFAKVGGLGVAISLPLANATKTFAQFDDQMRTVQAVTGATAAEMKALAKQAGELGDATSFSGAEVAGGMISLGRMGFNSGEIQNAIRAVMDLSRATGTEMGTAAEIAANAMRGFGMSAADMALAADIMGTTANSSAQSLVDLGEALKMAAPSASQAGASLMDVNAALGILANMGIKGSLAGTALAKSYKRMADPKVQEFLKQYNIQTVDAAGNLRNMAAILRDVGAAMAGMTNAQRITFAEDVFDARGSLGGGVLAANVDAMDQLMAKLQRSGGYVAKAAADMDAGVGGSLRRLSSAAEGFSRSFGEVAGQAYMPWIEWSARAILSARDVMQQFPRLTAAASLAGGAFSEIAKGLGTLSMALGSAPSAIQALTSAYNSLTGATARNAAVAAARANVEKAQQTLAAASAALLKAQARSAQAQATANALAGTSGAALARANVAVATTAQAVVTAQTQVANAARAVTTATAAQSAAMATQTGVVIGLRGAFTRLWAVVAAHPYTAALAAAAALLGVLNSLADADRANIDLAQEAAQATEARIKQEEKDAAELKALAEKGQLNNAEMTRALELQQRLAKSGLEATLNRQTRTLTVQADAWAKLTAAQKKARIEALKAEMKQTRRAMAEAKAEKTVGAGEYGFQRTVNAVGFGVQKLFGRERRAVWGNSGEENTALDIKISKYETRIKELEDKIRAAENSANGAAPTTGSGAGRTADPEAIKRAKTEEERLERRLWDMAHSRLQSQIRDVEKERDTYVQMLRDAGKSEDAQAEAIRKYQLIIDDLKKQTADEYKRQAEALQKSFRETRDARETRLEEQQQDREVARATSGGNAPAALKILDAQIAAAEEQTRSAAAERDAMAQELEALRTLKPEEIEPEDFAAAVKRVEDATTEFARIQQRGDQLRERRQALADQQNDKARDFVRGGDEIARREATYAARRAERAMDSQFGAAIQNEDFGAAETMLSQMQSAAAAAKVAFEEARKNYAEGGMTDDQRAAMEKAGQYWASLADKSANYEQQIIDGQRTAMQNASKGGGAGDFNALTAVSKAMIGAERPEVKLLTDIRKYSKDIDDFVKQNKGATFS